MNKKLWSFNFGCVFAATFVWLASVSGSVPVPAGLSSEPNQYLEIYDELVTVGLAILTSFLCIGVMSKVFSIKTSDHFFWLLIPSAILLFLVVTTDVARYSSILFAAIPFLSIVCMDILFGKLRKYSKNKKNQLSEEKAVGELSVSN